MLPVNNSYCITGHVHGSSCIKFQFGSWVRYHWNRKKSLLRNPPTVYDIGDPELVEDVHACVAHWKATMIDTTTRSRTKVHGENKRKVQM